MRKKSVIMLMILMMAIFASANRKLDNLIKDHKYQKAFDYVGKKFPPEKRTINIWEKTGVILEGLGKSEKAISCYIAIISKDQHNEEALWSLVRLYEKLGYYYNAYSRIQSLIRIKGSDPEVLLEASKICNNLKKYDEAERYLLNINQVTAETQKELGNVYYNRGQYNEAIPFYTSSFSLSKNLEVAKKIVEYYKGKDDISVALEHFQYVADNDNNASSVKSHLAAYWVRAFAKATIMKSNSLNQKRLESDHVKNVSERTVRHKGVDFNVYANIGDAYAKLGNNENAIISYKIAVKLNPHEVSNLIKLAQCQVIANYIDDAILSYEKIIAGWNTQTVTLKILGDLYNSKGMLSEAVIYYKMFLQSGIDNRVANYVAMYEYRNGNYGTALEFFDKVTSLSSENVYAQGKSYQYLRKYHECIKVLTGYTVQYPQTKDYYDVNRIIGVAYDMLNNDKAIDYYLIYLRKHDDNNIAYRVGELLEKIDKKSALEVFKQNCEKYPLDYRNFFKIGELIKNEAISEELVKYP